MQTRKRSVKAFNNVTLAERLRASWSVHRTQSVLVVPGPPIAFLQDCPEVAATKVEAGIDTAFGSNPRTLRRHSPSSHNPKPAGAIVDFIRPISEYAITVAHRADDAYLFVAVASRISIDL